MLRFFEPEMETRWPNSAAFPVEFHQIPASRGDSDFSLLPSSSLASLLAGQTSGHDLFSKTQNSSTAADFDKLLGGGFFTNYEDGNSFQLGNFSPPTTSTSTTQLNSIPGLMKNNLLAAAVKTSDHLMTPKSSSAATTSIKNINKMADASEGKAKRQKTTASLSSSSDETAVSPTQLTKEAPTRRSQKLGDRITALQQLVSPYGKTDTASVLFEASICIKYLHEQIQRLTTPYLGGGRLGQRLKGLCLAPITPDIVRLTNKPQLDRFTDRRLATGQQFRS